MHFLPKNLSRIVGSILLLLFITPVVWGQYTNFKFENLDTSEGLSSSTCLTIFQDSQGFLWFGTIDGLNKYNGYGFEVYKSVLNDSTSISNNRINAIEEDSEGNLWIGTNNGLNFFNKENDSFTLIDLYQQVSPANNPLKFINRLLFDAPSNSLWVATNNGLVKILLDDFDNSIENLKFSYYINDGSNDKSLDNNIVNVILKDQEGVIWASTDGNHLNRYDKEKDNFDRILIRNENDYALNHIPKNIFVDADNDFWIGNNLANMVLWNRKKNIFEHLSFIKEDIAVRDFYLDEHNIIWAATDGHGLFLLNKKENKIEHNLTNNFSDPFSLPNNKPSKIYEDKDGIFWIGSYDKGVSKFDPTLDAFNHYYYQPGNPIGLNEKIVQSVLQDSKERIWISAYNGGLNLFSQESNSFQHFGPDPEDPNSLSSDKILYTFESREGDIWVCTLDGGVNRFNPETYKAERFLHQPSNPYSIGQNSVWSGVEDNENRLWLGLRTEGLSLYDPESKRFYNYKNTVGQENNLASNFVFFLFVDSQNRLLVGTSLGLNVVDLNQLDNHIPESISFSAIQIPGIKDNLVNYITEDHLGNIWIGADTGIYKLDSELNLIRPYSSKDGLPNNLVVGICEDDNLNFWVTTKNGLSFLDPKTDQIKNFNVHDGLQGPEYQSKSIDKTKDGRILIGGINGFNIFHPDDISKDRSVTLQPRFTSLKVNNRKVVVGDTLNDRVLLTEPLHKSPHLELKHNENYVSFEFLALHFENPEEVQYAYKLQGLDKEFETVSSIREINYSNLMPGDYSFVVKASLDKNWVDTQEAALHFEILSPPWKTWWAYTLYLILFLALLWAGIYYYTKGIREEKERELDQMKLQFFVNVSHEFRTPLTLILNPVHKILSDVGTSEGIKSSASTIQRSARRLLHLVNQLLDYRKMDVGMYPLQLEKGNIVTFCKDIFSLFEELASKKGIKFRFETATNNITTLFDFDKLEKIITNLISNAIKFTDTGGTITVSVIRVSAAGHKKVGPWSKNGKVNEHVEIKVADTGVGLNQEQLKNIFSRFYHPDAAKSGTGIGLNFTKALVEMHGGHISVESQRKEGSTFTVRLPIDVKSKPDEVENVKNEYLFNSVKAVEYEMAMTDAEASSAESTAMNAEQPTILVVEDNKELRKHLVKDLYNNYNVKEAGNGVKGLEMAKKYYPDLVISDVMMPKMDGFEMCKLIKEDFDTCHIPVLLLTAKTLDTDRIEGYGSGADGYLDKPFVTSVLKARISNLLETKKRLRQRFSEIGGLFPSREVTTNNLDEAFLDKATKIILDNIEDFDFKQKDLLRELGIGRSQLYRKINSLTGNNPSHFIRTIKLRYASGLLQRGQHSIKEVTYMSGFNSTAYFSKTFKELFDMTPTEYMEQKGKEPAKVDL